MRSKSYVWSRSIALIAGSNPAVMDVRLVFILCSVDSGLCDELINRSEGVLHCVCVCVCVYVANTE